MSRAPWVMPKPEHGYPRGTVQVYDTTLGWRFVNPRLAAMFPPESMGETAENVAERYGIAREAQDRFALASQRKWAAAQAAGKWRDEIVPVEVPRGRGETVVVDVDEHPRPDTTLEKLAALPPAFRPGGTVTAGNSSGINDGAAALVVMADTRARQLGLRPLAGIAAGAVAGVDPRYMGIGPVPATRKVLARAGWSVADLDLVELNEVFAALIEAVD